MRQERYNVSISPDGRVLLQDPDFELKPLIEKIIPDFSIKSCPPKPSFIPSFQVIRKVGFTDLNVDDLTKLSKEELWEIHNKILSGEMEAKIQGNNASLLDIKVELANRILLNCTLCGRKCRVNRFEETGKCGLRNEAYYSALFTHISEEPVITPALVVKLIGCALDCVHCQAYENREIRNSKRLDENVWKELEKIPGFKEAKSLEFVGGNPDESVAEILWVLCFAPEDFKLPIVWDCNCYGTKFLYRLLNGVVDVWLPDLKYGNNDCAHKISGINNYWEISNEGIKEMVKQEYSKVLVRIPILPNHFDCCYKKILEFLSQFNEKIWLSISDQYVPEHRALDRPSLNRMVSIEEIKEVKELAKIYELQDIWENSDTFWENT